MSCFITGIGSFLPGPPITNDRIPEFMGDLDGESGVREKILRMNGIKSRHYTTVNLTTPGHTAELRPEP